MVRNRARADLQQPQEEQRTSAEPPAAAVSPAPAATGANGDGHTPGGKWYGRSYDYGSGRVDTDFKGPNGERRYCRTYTTGSRSETSCK